MFDDVRKAVTSVVRESGADRTRNPVAVTSGRFDALLVATFAALLSAAGAARPSLWFDEAATISAATRTLQHLWRMLGSIDAVHGVYYVVMHGWFAVFPATELWVRVPSCLAIGVTAAGVVVLARRFTGRTFAVTAGVVFAVLPRATWAAIEARPYALATACAVWLTVLLVDAARRDRPTWWLCYGAALIGTTAVNLFTVLLVLPHAVAVFRIAAPRRAVARWAVVIVATLPVMVPFGLLCRTQIAQVGWIKPVRWKTLWEIGFEQYFDHSVGFAVGCAVLLIASLALGRFALLDDASRSLLVVSIAWMALPTLVLVVYSVVAEPIYYPRYLCFTSPAAAFVIASCVTVLFRTRVRVTAALIVLALAAAPNFALNQRQPYAKEGMDFSQIADLVTARAAPGDCIVFDNTVMWMPGPVRPVRQARPEAYAKLVDPGRGMPAADRNTLWDAHIAVWLVADEITRCAVLWTVTDLDHTFGAHEAGVRLDPGPRMRRAPAYQVPERLGFHIVERWQFNFAQVTRSVKEPSSPSR